MNLLPRHAQAIDYFQSQVGFLTAKEIARRANVPLIGSKELTRLTNPKCNLLTVALGPFKILVDEKFTMWQPFWVSVIETGKPFGDLIAASLVVLNSKGNMGYYQIRLWDIYTQKFNYYGNQNSFLNKNIVVNIISEHLTSQYHVGFVEKKETSNRIDHSIIDVSQKIISNKDELDYQISEEERVQKKRGH